MGVSLPHMSPPERLRPRASNRLLAVLALAAALNAPAPARAGAQVSPLVVEVRGGSTLPADGFLDGVSGWEGEGGEALSFGVDFVLTWADRWGWMAGFGQHRVECPAEACMAEEEWVATGFDLGLRALLWQGRVTPWISGAAGTYKLERHPPEGAGGEVRTSERSWGWEAGAGFYVILHDRIYLNPGGRYLSLRFEEPGALDLRLWVLDLGMVLAF